MMMSLGLFVFALDTAPYQELQQRLAWRHPANSRVGVRPALQFTGPDGEAITLAGTLYPGLTGGEPALDELREMADEGEAYPLVDGTGRVYGMFAIERLDIGRETFFQDGAARRLNFSLQLARADDDAGMLTPG